MLNRGEGPRPRGTGPQGLLRGGLKPSDRGLALLAIFAMGWVVLRACVQSITIDEATTYVLFVAQLGPQHWVGSSNNHVLNSALMRLSTHLFGVSELTARLPALLGAAFYITACYRFCRRLPGEAWLRWVVMICLVYSPMVMDYLVAARGYALALGFLMTALVCDPRRLSGCILASTFIGLAFSSNFSFAFVCATVTVGLFVWSLRSSKIGFSKLAAAYAIPELLVTWVLSAQALFSFPANEFYYGARSLVDSIGSTTASQTRYLNADLLGRVPTVYSVLSLLQPYFYPLLFLTILAGTLCGWRRMPPVARLFGGAFTVTALLYVAAFHLRGLPYPLDRTGVFFVPLGFGFAASMATIPAEGRARWLRGAQIGALALIAVNNILCLRTNYFQVWAFDQDTREAYMVLNCLHDREGVQKVVTDWPFTSALSFYHDTALHGAMGEIPDVAQATPATEVFVVDESLNSTISRERGLTPVWKAPHTKMSFEVPPAQLERLKGSACFR